MKFCSGYFEKKDNTKKRTGECPLELLTIIFKKIA
jgi:hypothetical protein